MKYTLLYIDDEDDNLNVFKSTFRHQYTVLTANSVKAAIPLLREIPVHVIISDYKMPGENGVEFFKNIKSEWPNIERIILTAFNESEIVIRSINEAGIFSFVTKPWQKTELQTIITNAINSYELKAKNVELIDSLTRANSDLETAVTEVKRLKGMVEIENTYLKKQLSNEYDGDTVIGESKALKAVLEKIEQVAPLDTTVLILGETGTGKELVARSVHAKSQRSAKPFVKLNCAALPATLVESELFGYEKGAFTSASNTKVGMFEVANEGTIFLDEIGEVPIELQAKLLRVLQDGEFYRIGGNKTIRVNVRIIAATNRVLEKQIEKGLFRPDLYYRLNVFPIRVPALRERHGDIPALIRHFVSKFQRKLGLTIHTIPDEVFRALKNHQWPGNIRELEALVERSMIMSKDGVLDLSDWSSTYFTPPPTPAPPPAAPSAAMDTATLQDIERQHILNVLARVNWKISGKNSASELLQVNHNTLRSKMIKLGIKFR